MGVRPNLDVAFLKFLNDEVNDEGDDNNNKYKFRGGRGSSPSSSPSPPLSVILYGLPSNLLVGQRPIAIGNIFGIDQNETSGVVSYLNWEV